jgi:hypothetical protein
MSPSYVTSTSGRKDNILTHRIVAQPTQIATHGTNAFDWNLKSADENAFLVSNARQDAQTYSLETLFPDKGEGDFIVPIGSYWVVSMAGQILKGWRSI